ncbi:hypothetical protein Vretifemale_17056, partial [Volvox reticuliferus]
QQSTSSAAVEQQPALSSPPSDAAGGGDDLQAQGEVLVEQQQQHEEEPVVVEEQLKPTPNKYNGLELLLGEQHNNSSAVRHQISLDLDQQLLSSSLVELQALESLVVKQPPPPQQQQQHPQLLQPQPTESATSPPNGEQLHHEQDVSVRMLEDQPIPSSLPSTALLTLKEQQTSLLVVDDQPESTTTVNLQEHDVFRGVEEQPVVTQPPEPAGQQEGWAPPVEGQQQELPLTPAAERRPSSVSSSLRLTDELEVVQHVLPPSSLPERRQPTPLLSPPPAETAEMQPLSSPVTGQKHVTLLRRRHRWLLLCRRVMPTPATQQPRMAAEQSAKPSCPEVDEQSTSHQSPADNLPSLLSFEVELWDPSSEAPPPQAQPSSTMPAMNIDLQALSQPLGKEPMPSTLSLEVKLLEPTSMVAVQEPTELAPFNDDEVDTQKYHTVPSSTLSLEVKMLESSPSVPSAAAEQAMHMPSLSLEVKLLEPQTPVGEHEPTPWPPSPEPYQIWAPSSPSAAAEQNPMSTSLSIEVKLCSSSSFAAPSVEEPAAPEVLLEALPPAEQQPAAAAAAAAAVPKTLSLEIKLQDPSPSSLEDQQQHPLPSTLSLEVKLWEPSSLPQQAGLMESSATAQSTAQQQQQEGDQLQESQQPSEEHARAPAVARPSPALRSVITQVCVSVLCMAIIPRVLPVGGRLLAYVSNLPPFRGGQTAHQLTAGIATEVAAAAGLQTQHGVVAVEVGAADIITSPAAGASSGAATSQFDLDKAYSECNSK